MNTIIINGNKIQVAGNNISVNNDSVYVDWKLVQGGLQGIVKLEFKGDLVQLKSSASVTVNGDVKGNVDAGGSVSCGHIGGSVDAGSSVVNCLIWEDNLENILIIKYSWQIELSSV